MQESRTAIVIGAGVVGMATAYALARRGWRVALVDGEAEPAQGASKANGAQLSYCYTDALASPRILATLPSILLGRSGVRVRAGIAPGYLAWLAAFVANCTQARFRKNTAAALELAGESRAALEELLRAHDLSFGHRVAGKLHLYYADAEFAQAKKALALKRAAGCEQELVAADDLSGLSPAFSHLPETPIGAILTRSEAVGDPRLFCHAMLELLRERYAAQARFGVHVEAVSTGPGPALVRCASGEALWADLAVVCAGIDSNRLLAPLAHAVPLQPMKGYSFEMPLAQHSPEVSVTDNRRRIVFTNLGDRMRVAGLAEVGNGSRDVEPRQIETLIATAQLSLPLAGDYDRATAFWAGLRPMTPDSRPVIAHPEPSLAINTGHGTLGWTMAMGSGERLARLVTRQEPQSACLSSGAPGKAPV